MNIIAVHLILTITGDSTCVQAFGISSSIGRFQSIKTGVLLIFSFITSDKTEFLSPMMFSNEYITGI